MSNSNPLPELLNLIPESDTMLSLFLADKMCVVIERTTNKLVNNGYILMLLAELALGGYIEFQELTWPGSDDKIFILKRVVNGNQNK